MCLSQMASVMPCIDDSVLSDVAPITTQKPITTANASSSFLNTGMRSNHFISPSFMSHDGTLAPPRHRENFAICRIRSDAPTSFTAAIAET